MNLWPTNVFLWLHSLHVPQSSIHITIIFFAWAFSKIKNLNHTTSLWKCGQHPKGCNWPTESSFAKRIQSLFPGVGEPLPAVYSFPRELFWRVQCTFFIKWHINISTGPVPLLVCYASAFKNVINCNETRLSWSYGWNLKSIPRYSIRTTCTQLIRIDWANTE